MLNPTYREHIEGALNKQAEQLEKPRTWFRYAKKLKVSGGYRLLTHKQDQINILECIAISLYKSLPNLTKGQIVDMISEVVNE